MLMLSKQFKQRLIVSSLGVLALFIAIYFSYHPFFKPIFVLLNVGAVSFALWEYYHLAEHKGFHPLVGLGIGSSAIYLITLALSLHQEALNGFPSLVLIGSFLLFFLSFFNQQVSPLGNLAVTTFGIIYLTLPLSCLIRINYFFPPNAAEDGRLWLAYVLVMSKITDVGAYFAGKALGKTKLAPAISPKKTIAGAIGGVVATLVASLLFVLLAGNSFKITLWQGIWLSLILSLLAQLGDLSESLLKRDAGVKDSSHLPGLGGVLDVVDSLVFTLPLMYVLLQMGVIGTPH